jgi:hypothetical protein
LIQFDDMDRCEIFEVAPRTYLVSLRVWAGHFHLHLHRTHDILLLCFGSQT